MYLLIACLSPALPKDIHLALTYLHSSHERLFTGMDLIYQNRLDSREAVDGYRSNLTAICTISALIKDYSLVIYSTFTHFGKL